MIKGRYHKGGVEKRGGRKTLMKDTRSQKGFGPFLSGTFSTPLRCQKEFLSSTPRCGSGPKCRLQGPPPPLDPPALLAIFQWPYSGGRLDFSYFLFGWHPPDPGPIGIYSTKGLRKEIPGSLDLL